MGSKKTVQIKFYKLDLEDNSIMTDFIEKKKKRTKKYETKFFELRNGILRHAHTPNTDDWPEIMLSDARIVNTDQKGETKENQSFQIEIHLLEKEEIFYLTAPTKEKKERWV